jgi:PAS domain S-box-containing protein
MASNKKSDSPGQTNPRVNENFTREDFYRLQESENRYQILFENMEEGFSLHEIITDKNNNAVNFRYLAVNTAFEHHTGLKREDVIGKTMLEIMPDADKKQIERYGMVSLTGKSCDFEYFSNPFKRYVHERVFRPQPRCFAVIFGEHLDGSFLINTIQPVLGEEEQVERLAIYSSDIIEKRRAEDAIRQTRKNYGALFSTIDEFIFVLDEQGNFIHTNSAVIDRLGFSEQEMAGNPVLMVHPPEKQ